MGMGMGVGAGIAGGPPGLSSPLTGGGAGAGGSVLARSGFVSLPSGAGGGGSGGAGAGSGPGSGPLSPVPGSGPPAASPLGSAGSGAGAGSGASSGAGGGGGGAPAAAGGGLNGSEDVIALPHRMVTHVAGVQAIGAVSWRGRSPTNFKINQDAVLVAEHAMSGSLLVAVLDGHGQLGREVSQFLRERLPAILFTDDRFLQLRAPPPPGSEAAAAAAAADGGATGPRWSLRGKGGSGLGSGAGAGAGGATEGWDADDDGFGDDASGTGPDGGRGGRGGGRGGRGGGRGGGAAGRSAGSTASAGGAPVSAVANSLVPLTPAALAEARALCDVLADALASAEAALLSSSGINCTLSGSTAVVLLIRNGVIHLVNVGDSRAVLAVSASGSVPVDGTKLTAASQASTMTGNLAPGGGVIGMPLPPTAGQPGTAPIALHQLRAAALASETCFAMMTVKSKMLTVDHKPETPRERQRITATGGRVMATRIKGAPHVSRNVQLPCLCYAMLFHAHWLARLPLHTCVATAA